MKRIVLGKIELIDLESIRQSTWETAIQLTKDIDKYDAPFIALSLELNAPFWTGDKKLSKGLRRKGVDWFLDTDLIKIIRDEK